LSAWENCNFTLSDKVVGLHRNNQERVRYDLVASPRPALIERGFDPGSVIVECKHFRPDEKKKHDVKVRDLLWQCVVYSYSDIVTSDGQLEKPLFVLYHISGQIDQCGLSELQVLHHFVQRGGVGVLEAGRSGEWVMQFGGSNYFHRDRGRGPHNVGTKRMSGSSR
jgi:hypothetical protein